MGFDLDEYGIIVSCDMEIFKNRCLIALSLLSICFGIIATIFGSNMGIGLVVAGGIALIIIGLVLSRPLARNVLRYLDKNGFQ